jgi:hypothetical protein
MLAFLRLIEKELASSELRRNTLAVDDSHGAVGRLDDDRDFTAEGEVRELDNRCGEYRSAAGIGRVASLLEQPQACFCGQGMACGNRASLAAYNRAEGVGNRPSDRQSSDGGGDGKAKQAPQWSHMILRRSAVCYSEVSGFD